MATKSITRKGSVPMCLILGAALLLSSCEKETAGAPEPAGESRTRLTLVVSALQTRASVTPHEGDVVSLDVLAFRAGDGTLDASSRVTGSGLTSVSADVSAGVPLRWKVVANAPSGAFASVTTEAGFESALTSLTDGTVSSLVMGASGTVTATDGTGPVSAGLDRYCCKVTVESVAFAWTDSFQETPVVTVERIALVNVVGTTPFSGVPAAGELWYNRMGIEEGLPDYVRDMTVKDYGSLPVGPSPVDVASPLYAMPNPVSNNVNSANSPEWSERCTRVAVELKVNGTSYWYPVDLPSMECNRHYIIRRLTVTGPGSMGPDYPVTRDGVTFTVDVTPWEDNDVVTDWTGS